MAQPEGAPALSPETDVEPVLTNQTVHPEALTDRAPESPVIEPEPEQRKSLQSHPRTGELAALALILLVAALLRFSGTNWGSNLYLHPDERFQTMVVTRIQWPDGIDAYFDSEQSTLNPYNNDFGTYIYGTFPLFVAKLAGDLTGNEVYGNAHLPGRIMSGICDLISVVLIYLIGRRLFGVRTGLLAAALLAVTVMHIQAAHFFAPDLYVVASCLAAFYLVLKAEAEPRWWWFAGAGVAVGLAMASKISALPIVAVLALPLLEGIRRSGVRAVTQSRGRGFLSPFLGSALAIVATIWTFRVAQPYAFLGPNPFSFRLDQRWVNDIRYWQEVQSGTIDIPPGLQWADRAPVLFGLKNLVLWGMGPLLGLTALAGLLFAGYVAVTRRRLPPVWLLVLVGWPAFHLVYYGLAFVQTMRYFLPAYPFLVLLAAAGLTRLARHGQRQGWPTLPMPRGTALPLGTAPTVLVLIATVLYALAFSGIYSRTTTREAASRWIYQNVPAGSVIASEHWDDGIPVSLPGFNATDYEGFQLELFWPDSDEKLATVLDQLDRADYIVVTSNRLYGTIPRIPERFPMTSEYYRMLFSGELGFDLVHEETSYPSLLGIELNDDGAEEAFTVYDHPKVFVFQKSDAYSRGAIEPRLTAALGDGGYAIGPLEAGINLLMFDNETRAEQQAGGTWRAMFDTGNLANRAPVLFWYLALQLMALAALPLCWRLFEHLPDRGYAVAKTAGVLLVSYVAWLLAGVGAVSFGRVVIAVGVVAIAGLSLLAIRGKWRQLPADMRSRWQMILATEVLFLVAFLLMVWVRMQNPDLWHRSRGGEKPMDFAYFNAVLRSTSFPAIDPWFAGGYLNYYYFGFVQWASVTRLTGIVPEVAYNLAVPSILALLAINVWSLVVAIVARIRSADAGVVPRRHLALGLAAPVFIVVLGNLDLARRVGRGEFGYPPGGFSSRIPGLGSIADILSGIGNAIAHRPPLPDDLYWSATRVVPGTINEFPFFTFLFADLHAHMMAMPLASAALLLALQIALSGRPAPVGTMPDAVAPELTARTPSDGGMLFRARLVVTNAWRAHGQVTVEVIAAGVLTSALYATNTWDYPTALVILLGALVIREGARAQWRPSYPVAIRIGVWAAAVILAGRIAFWPFYANFHTRGGVIRFHDRTALGDYLTIHGVMLVAIGGFLALQVAPAMTDIRLPRGQSVLRPGWSGHAGIVGGQAELLAGIRSIRGVANPVQVGVIGSSCLIALGLIAGSLPLFLLGALALVLTAAWTQRSEPARLLVLLITAVAIGLSLAVEFIALKGDIGRMNTVFKFYLQIWMLFGVAAAVAVCVVIMDRDVRRGTATGVWAVVLAVLVLAAAIYPVLSTQARVGDRFASLPPTLDGMAYMDHAIYDDAPENRQPVKFPLAGDAAAIDWLRANVDGSPVVLEASIPGYRWGSRVSVYTGLPTVLGWDWHQTQQRPGFDAMIRERRDAVARLFGETSSFEAIRPLLDRYNVGLIYVGELERAYYDASALAKFDAAASAGELRVVYWSESVTIYAYDGRQGV